VLVQAAAMPTERGREPEGRGSMIEDAVSYPCAVCEQEDPDRFRVFFDGPIKLYRCLQCGFIGQFPGPGRPQAAVNYETAYTLDFAEKHEFMYPHRGRYLHDILDRVANIRPSGRILDVGCGDGHFLSLWLKAGYECSGVEPSQALAAYARAKTGAEVVQGLYEKSTFPEGSFDVVVMIHVLEHILRPRAALEAARHHLRPEGLLVLDVPSVRSPHFLAYRWTGAKWFVRPPHGAIRPHYGYYEPRTLMLLAQSHGFRTISLATGRWQHKYRGIARLGGKVLDPILNALGIGGVLYIGAKDERSEVGHVESRRAG